MVTKFLDLPIELLTRIFKLIPNQTSRVRFLCACRRFHDILNPLLYRNIYQYRNPAHLAKTLLTHRELAANVRVIREISDFGPHFLSSPRPNFSDADIAYVKQLLSQFMGSGQAEVANDNLEQLLEGNDNDTTWMGLVLLMVPQITDITFSIEFLCWRNINRISTFQVLRRAACQSGSLNRQPFFKNLTSIHVKWYDTEGGVSTHYVAPLFGLPSLKQFSGQMIIEENAEDEDDDEDTMPRPSQNTSSVENLELFMSNGGNGMRTLIELCAKSLKSFIYRHADGSVSGDCFDPVAFSSSLALARETLEYLWLDFDSGWDAQGEESEDEYFGSLVNYRSLKSLHMRIQNLGNSEVLLDRRLPPKLEYLHISDMYNNTLPIVVPQLIDIIEQKPRKLQSLKRIVLEGYFNEPVSSRLLFSGQVHKHKFEIMPESYKAVEPLVQICSGYGISVFLRDSLVHGEQDYEDPELNPYFGWDGHLQL